MTFIKLTTSGHGKVIIPIQDIGHVIGEGGDNYKSTIYLNTNADSPKVFHIQETVDEIATKMHIAQITVI